VNATSTQPFSPGTVSSILTLYHVNYFFIILGDLIIGINIIRVGVYPRWTGYANIVLAGLNFIYVLAPQATVFEVVAALLAATITGQWGLTFLKRSPDYQQQYRNQ
jgi:membrane protein implicated in regulation of membrane protease activity